MTKHMTPQGTPFLAQKACEIFKDSGKFPEDLRETFQTEVYLLEPKEPLGPSETPTTYRAVCFCLCTDDSWAVLIQDAYLEEPQVPGSVPEPFQNSRLLAIRNSQVFAVMQSSNLAIIRAFLEYHPEVDCELLAQSFYKSLGEFLESQKKNLTEIQTAMREAKTAVTH